MLFQQFEERRVDGGSCYLKDFVYNNMHSELRNHLFRNSKVRLIAHLPGGCFAPYTLARTAILFLTDKEAGVTECIFQRYA